MITLREYQDWCIKCLRAYGATDEQVEEFKARVGYDRGQGEVSCAEGTDGA